MDQAADTPTITFSFTLDQTNRILGSLANRPYNEVVDLISEIKRQGDPQYFALQHDDALKIAATPVDDAMVTT